MVFGVRNAPKMIQRLQKGDPEDAKAGPRAPGSKDGPGTLGGSRFLQSFWSSIAPQFTSQKPLKNQSKFQWFCDAILEAF